MQTVKKEFFSPEIRKFRRDLLKSHIWLTASPYRTKYLCISPYFRKPFLKYDFAPDPLWISLYIRNFFFIFLSLCMGKDTPWTWPTQNFMKFGTPTGLCEKLKNPKYYISVTTGYGSHSIFLKWLGNFLVFKYFHVFPKALNRHYKTLSIINWILILNSRYFILKYEIKIFDLHFLKNSDLVFKQFYVFLPWFKTFEVKYLDSYFTLILFM